MLISSNIYDYFSSLLSKNIKQNNSVKKKKYFAVYILYIIGAISYFFSLHKIEGIGMNCFRTKRLICLSILISLIFISSFFISISLYLIIFKNYKKIHLFIISIIYLIFYIIDHNDTIIRHGLYNFVAFIFSTLSLFLIFCFINFIYYLFIKKNIIIIFSIFITICYFIFKLEKYKLNYFSCDSWAKGLNNSYIDNIFKDYPCKIDFPKEHSCYLSTIGPYFDFSKIYRRTTCLEPKLILYDKQKYIHDTKNLKYIQISKKNHFGYPLTNNKKFSNDYYGCLIFPGNKSFENDINKNVILSFIIKMNIR